VGFPKRTTTALGTRVVLLDYNTLQPRPWIGYWLDEDDHWYPDTWLEGGRYLSEEETCSKDIQI